MMGRFVRGMLLGALFVLAVGIWPAHAQIDTGYTKVTVPGNGSVLRGSYESDGTPKAFKHTVRAQARTTGGNCDEGFSSIKIWVTGSDYSDTLLTTSTSSGTSWSGGPSSPWDTQSLKNGVYSVKFTVTERDTGGLFSCNGNGTQPQTYPAPAVSLKVANAPVAPEWSGSPSAASDGSAAVALTWKKNPEPDVVNYHIVRTGPGGSVTAVAPASVCGENTCQAEDRSFPAEYSGSYSYQITTYRAAPSGTGDPCTSGSSNECVTSNGSEIKSVTLTKPTPSPTPSPSGSPGGTPTTRPGGGSTGGGSTPSTAPRGNTSVLSFGGGGGGSDFASDFYSGTFDENLPYQPKTLVIGNGKSTTPGERNEAVAFSEDPPNYRTIMLPVAGGLLAFLSAAHVRRLLIHF